MGTVEKSPSWSTTRPAGIAAALGDADAVVRDPRDVRVELVATGCLRFSLAPPG